MDKAQTIRASEAPIVVECGLAATPPTCEVDTSGTDASLGRAVHDSIQGWIDGGRKGEPEAQPYANAHGADPAMVLELALAAPTALAQIREDLAAAQAEVKIDGGGVRGRIDVLGISGKGKVPHAISIIDWKTGRDPQAGTKVMQRLAYASAAEAVYGMPAQGYIYAAEAWLAAEELIESRFDLDTIKGFRRRLADRLAYPTAHPGEHCRYCRRLHQCAPRDAYLRSAAAALVEVGDAMPTAEALAAVWDQSRALKQAIEKYEKAVDLAIEPTGALELPDGRRIEHMVVTRDHIDARKAWPVLTKAGLGADDINRALTVSKTKLLGMVSARAARGRKVAEKTNLVTALDIAGAISRTASRRKRVS